MNKETQKTKFLKGMKDKKDLPFAGQPFDVVIPYVHLIPLRPVTAF